jgi:hypothetical protein
MPKNSTGTAPDRIYGPIEKLPLRLRGHDGNVRGEPVFSVMAASWFCEKSGCIGKVEDVKPVLLKEKRFSTVNHLVLGFRLLVHYRFVAV